MMAMPRRRTTPRRLAADQGGMMLVGVMVALAALAAATVTTTVSLAQSQRRANEVELLFVGEQYRQAIESYWRESPGGIRQYPSRFEDLIDDKRFPQPKRHLRKLFKDPMAPQQEWGVVRQGAAILGVYSQAEGEPFMRTGFDRSQAKFEDARSYANWVFQANLTVTTPGMPSTQNKSAPGLTPAPIFNAPAPNKGVAPTPRPLPGR